MERCVFYRYNGGSIQILSIKLILWINLFFITTDETPWKYVAKLIKKAF